MISIDQAKTDEDLDYVKSVIIDDDEMWERSSDDFISRDGAFIYESSCIWLNCSCDGKNVGVGVVNPAGASVVNVHIHIPKEHRGKNTKAIGKEILQWIKRNASKRYHKINTKIPVIHKDVIRYAHSLGFKDEGIDRLSIMKNGELLDRLNLGITFGEII